MPEKPAKQPGYKNLNRGRWKKGESGNPKGRQRKDVSLTSLLKVEMEKLVPGDKEGRTWREFLVFAWMRGAATKPVLLQELLNRLEGKAVQPLEHTGKDGGPIETVNLIDDLHRKAKAHKEGNE